MALKQGSQEELIEKLLACAKQEIETGRNNSAARTLMEAMQYASAYAGHRREDYFMQIKNQLEILKGVKLPGDQSQAKWVIQDAEKNLGYCRKNHLGGLEITSAT